jgi:hypothetical protein
MSMKSRSVLRSGLGFVLGAAFSVVLIPEHAAQAQPRTGTPEVLPPSNAGTGTAGTGTGGASGPAVDPNEPKKPPGQLGGYAYDDKPKPGAARAPRATYRAKTGPVVNMPGFEQTGDGGSRLFVQLSQNVQVEERKAQGAITYVLKGASPRVHNNTNALVTVHFNTPVSRARLVPQGHDLHFIVEMRASATPTWKINEGQDKSAVLAIDFPKGDYLNLPAASAEQTPAKAGAQKAGRGGKRGPARPAPAPAPATTPEGPATN